MQFRHKGKRDRWIDYRVSKRRPNIMAANLTNSLLPNEEAISSLVRRVYRAMTEEVPSERSPVSGRNSNNVEDELSRKPPLCNPQVNYGSNYSSGKKWRLRSSS